MDMEAGAPALPAARWEAQYSKKGERIGLNFLHAKFCEQQNNPSNKKREKKKKKKKKRSRTRSATKREGMKNRATPFHEKAQEHRNKLSQKGKKLQASLELPKAYRFK
ncbi:hypothetical protein POVCU2_0026000 [Plasmodium ovale curtisi]|uniref:Uncharacterized protein n=1 Tax=Plasmodium ovale curtisi TaxID=864141 RepID=A0A1A8VV35_PLAOA|nr:hypothetical protein POVCU2_0026000 [Plasmodium ovale curtisi]